MAFIIGMLSTSKENYKRYFNFHVMNGTENELQFTLFPCKIANAFMYGTRTPPRRIRRMHEFLG